ncbi:PfkB family carbohydrate kinase [Aquabacterium sp.]|uniref:PfkB family carbohydrate kinase n=1 Tax=Aquabacterium sp. TaxID=1872578 RepID=UPI0035B0CBCB
MTALPPTPRPPVIWSIAGHDSCGGAGLSADQRAADALGVHLCPVVAALTAQHSQGVQAVYPTPPAQLQSQLRALAEDLPPRAIKTGLLGSVAAIELVAQWVDRWRERAPAGVAPHQHLALIVDPVLGASSGGAAFSNDSIVAAYRTLLIPRATVLTPNHAEACRLLGHPSWQEQAFGDAPELARELQALGARSVVITGGDAPATTAAPHCLDWISTPQASGWLTAPRVPTPHTHGTGCTFASGIAAARALGHVEADAIVLAKMLTHHALTRSHAAGAGPGPVLARPGFAAGPRAGGAPLPWLGLADDLPWRLTAPAASSNDAPLFLPFASPPDGLYGIAPDSAQLHAALRAGLRCVQLRHKPSAGLDPHLLRSLQDAREAGAQLFVNDHWRPLLALLNQDPVDASTAAPLGLHLGQEDLLALGATDRAALLAARDRLMLGLSSHSLWELALAAGCGASLIACGPVQPTTTKDMPWRAQGERNLRWWVANSPAPVAAIGGLLTPDDLARFAACGPAALCVVRALQHPEAALTRHLADLRRAVEHGRRTIRPAPALSMPTDLPDPVLA